MTDDQKRTYDNVFAAVADADGHPRFRPITDLRRDELLAAYWSLQKAYLAAQEELKSVGYSK